MDFGVHQARGMAEEVDVNGSDGKKIFTFF